MTGSGQFRSWPSVQALTIKWNDVTALTTKTVVVTGDDETLGEDEVAAPQADASRPIVVLICDDDETCEQLEELETIVLADEKIALAMHAFRTVRMTSASADAEPLLEGRGKAVPRIVILDVARDKATVLEKKKLKVSKLYSALKQASGRFYKQGLAATVKKSLKLLGEQDKLGVAEGDLLVKKEDLDPTDKGDQKKIEQLQEQLDAVTEELEALKTQFSELWDLTPRSL